MEYKDYYKILGVPKNATTEDINKVYRRLARKYHPDLNPGDKGAEARFKEINEAHEVLADAEKRKQYDALGPSWGRPGFDIRTAATRARARATGTADTGATTGEGFSDFFQTIFGQAGRAAGRGTAAAPKPRRGD